jgi:hypothetical protein
MNNLEIITAKNVDRIYELGSDLAETYKIAFAGPPWFEVSRCDQLDCSVGLSGLDVGCPCPGCKTELTEAYKTDELISSWCNMLSEEDGFMEVAIEDGLPQRATIARPTTPNELWLRKYSDVPAMKAILARLLPESFVWIEDTFANRQRRQNGNLKQRGDTLDRVAQYYGGMSIATRTLAEQIVYATLRDKRANTAVYLGNLGAGRSALNLAFANPGYELPSVPDRRTLIIVKNG